MTYTYRGDGLRHSKITGGVTTTYTWDLNQELPVILQEGNTSYVWGLGLISQTTGTGKRYFLAGGLGSTAVFTESSHRQLRHDVFGAIKASTGADSTDFKFTGQQDDPTAGLQYLRARYYDPETGRFLSKDPLRGFQTNPQTQNSYSYAINSPINFSDPTGRLPHVLAAVIGGGIIGGISGVVGAVMQGEDLKGVLAGAGKGLAVGALVGGAAALTAGIVTGGMSAASANVVGGALQGVGGALEGFFGNLAGQSGSGNRVSYRAAALNGGLAAVGPVAGAFGTKVLAATGHSTFVAETVGQLASFVYSVCLAAALKEGVEGP